jgi:hypothetical protein
MERVVNAAESPRAVRLRASTSFCLDGRMDRDPRAHRTTLGTAKLEHLTKQARLREVVDRFWRSSAEWKTRHDLADQRMAFDDAINGLSGVLQSCVSKPPSHLLIHHTNEFN